MIYLALKSDMSPTVRNHLVKAQRSANALLGIINDILDFSKIEAGKMEIEATEFGLNAVVEQLLDAIILQTEKKGIEFLVRYDVNLPTRLIGDPMRLAQVLLNLCGNAIKFTESGEVELSFQRIDATDTGLTLQISVRDTGIGMTPEQRDRLFQKFTQADQSSSRRFGGTGLGLVICKHLVELMGGRIWIEHSEPGKGTTMCCTVQLKTVPNIDAIKLKLTSRAYPLLKGVRVLVVDDNDVSLQILAETLRLFQFDVHVASSGVKAIECLEQASSKPFDVVLIDWHMPGMNGDEVALRIHADRLIRHQPKVVMVTAYGREDVIKLANKAGVDGFLTKPVSPSSLLDAMLSVLGGGDFLLPEHKKAEAGGSIAVPPLFTGAKLLLAEDNEINREFAVELLHSMGIEVAVAMDGEEAVEKVRQEIYDAILMDIQMPKLDGLKATQQIRELSKTKQDRFASVPIIAMTAQAMAGDREKSLAAGMNDYITKPIDPERLISVLTQWVRVPEERRVATLTAAAQSTGTKAAREYSADMLALKSINAAQGIHRIGGKPDAYRKQLLRFREHYADAAETLQGLIAQQGLQAGEDYCHALKGVCGNLGAEELLACATEVDAALKQNKLPEAAQFAHLSRLLDEVVREIDGLVTPIRPVASLTGTALSAMLAKLATLLESDLGAAEALLNELRLGVAGTEMEPAMIEIAAKADAFETDAARQLIDALRARLVAVAG
jgi:CheY-like chemotaxis protein